jgi:hypothetical protein
MNIAERSFNILTARILWAYSLGKKKGVDIPEYDYCPGFNTQPNHFDFEILERKGRGMIVEREYFESRDRDPLRKGL